MKYTVALLGNPNCGKTTLFNTLTGSRQHVGNWSGVTVEKKTGTMKKSDILQEDIDVVDLPGIYGFSPYTMEEVIAKDYILKHSDDLIINVVDASNLERNLYLTSQTLALNVPMVVVLNMMDVVKRQRENIDIDKLSKHLGVPVIAISAKKRKGIKALEEAIEDIKRNGQSLEGRLLVSDEHSERERYELLSTIVEDVYHENTSSVSMSETIDRIVTHKVLALPIFFLIMWVIYYVSIQSFGSMTIEIVDQFFSVTLSDAVSNGLLALGAAPWLDSLIVGGIIGGVGTVLTFVPQIMLLFVFITILEDSGYMARIALVMDRYFRRFGLTGKSIIPMLVGSGCSVPGIMATRTLENDKDRKLTILLTPFISCGAKMPIYVLFASAFFPGASGTVIFAMYFLGIAVAIGSGIILNKLAFKGEISPFVMELPNYNLPTVRSVLLHVWDKGKGFIKKAGTLIFAASVIVWFLQSFNLQLQMIDDASLSILGTFGRFIAPIFEPLGFGNWMASVAVLTGMVAKEAVVSTLGVLTGLGEVSETSNALASQLQTMFTPASAISFMTFNLLASPCIAALGTMKKEFNSWKWTIFAICYQTGVAWLVSMIIYQVVSRII